LSGLADIVEDAHAILSRVKAALDLEAMNDDLPPVRDDDDENGREDGRGVGRRAPARRQRTRPSAATALARRGARKKR
jgi:hypothetical protein